MLGLIVINNSKKSWSKIPSLSGSLAPLLGNPSNTPWNRLFISIELRNLNQSLFLPPWLSTCHCINHCCQGTVQWRSNIFGYWVRKFGNMCARRQDDVGCITATQLCCCSNASVAILQGNELLQQGDSLLFLERLRLSMGSFYLGLC